MTPNSRSYISQFSQQDPIIQDQYNSLDWNRYAYVRWNPINRNDPTGHFAWLPVLIGAGAILGAGINYASQVSVNYQSNGGDLGAALTTNINVASIGESALAGATVGLAVGVAAPVMIGLAGDALVGTGLVTGSTSLFSAGLAVTELSASVGAAIYGIDKAGEEIDLHRPYIRQGVRKEIENRALKTPDGKFIDPNTGEVIDGPYDLGHVPGHEYWREAAQAKANGFTQQEFNDKMNNPDYYQIEAPSSNRNHRFEMR